MTLKALSWGRSSELLLFLILSHFCASNAMQVHTSQDAIIFDQYGVHIAEAEEILSTAPPHAKQLITHLTTPGYINAPYRSALFVGPPGTGKSATARAIAYKANWDLKILYPGEILKKERNAGSEELLSQLDAMAWKNGKPTVILLEEANAYLENFDDKNNDTGGTASSLWSFLDREMENPNIFLIGLMNRIDRLPPQIKSRMLGRCVYFGLPQSEASCLKILWNKFNLMNLKLSPDAQRYVNSNVSRLKGFSGRDFKEFAFVVQKESAGQAMVSQAHLASALDLLQRTVNEMKYNQAEPETEHAQRERHQRENRRLQLQLFIQQQLIHFIERRGIDWKDIKDKHSQRIVATYSPEQREIYEEIKGYIYTPAFYLPYRPITHQWQQPAPKKEGTTCILQ